MCIICAKPQGAKLPGEKTLRSMFSHNPHGAGFMYARNGVVEIRKGFMDYDAFRQALRNTCDAIGEDAPLVMHFRITTHGGTCPGNTHPFPLTADVAQMHRTSCNAKIGIAHNGIINITPRAADVSDTMEFIASVLVPIERKNKRFYEIARIRKGIAEAINGSRLAIMTGTGEIVRIGHWLESDGCYYSNDSYKPLDNRWYTYPTETHVRSTGSVRLPWETNARLYCNLMPLTDDDMIEDEDGFIIDGEFHAIDHCRRVYAIDIDDCVAYETDAHVLGNVRYDRKKAVLFEIA